MMTECDTLLMVGSSFPYSEFLPKEGQARGVQIDIDPKHAQHPLSDGSQSGRRQRGNTCARSFRCSNARPDRAWREKIESDIVDWWKVLEARAMNEAQPDQSAARLLGTLAAAAGQLHPHRATPARRRTGLRAISKSGAA